MYFDDEPAATLIHTPRADYRVAQDFYFWHKLASLIFDAYDRAVERQHAVYQAHAQVFVLAEYTPECEVVFGV
jgi:hypothetical protein